jgi:hypothetical protein
MGLSGFCKVALSQNAPCGVSTRQKNPHLRSVNAGFYDYVVANPPFSVKTWTTGLTPESDPRYALMVPVAEIADGKNDENRNLPRYIDSTVPATALSSQTKPKSS